MKVDKEKELDNLFRQELDNPTRNTNFREDDWDAMEALLDENKKRRGLVFWLPVLGSVAAAMLIVFGIFFMKHTEKPTLVKNGIKTKTSTYPQQTEINIGSAQQQASVRPQANNVNGSSANVPQTTGNKIPTISNSRLSLAQNKGLKTSYQSKGLVDNGSSTVLNNSLAVAGANIDRGSDLIAEVPRIDISGSNTLLTAKNLIVPANTNNAIASATSKSSKISIKQLNPNRPRFALTVLASPDINGVSSFQNSRVGTNVGLMFAMGISKKFTISTGALYSKKPYLTDFDNYHSTYKFKTDPENVSADCRVLDIPVNVDYQLYSKARNKFSIGSGLSSYIMLRENYHYNYEYPGTAGPTDFTVVNRNQHFLGVLNLDATYQRQLNSKISLGVEPYLKIPLTNIGTSEVKLQSTGVAVGLTWNINSARR